MSDADGAYRTVFDAISDAIVLHDPESGAILDVNERFCDLFGYTRAEALDLSVRDITVDGWEPPVSARERIEQAREEGSVRFEWHDQRKDGSTFWAKVNLGLVEIGGDQRVLASIRDISRQKRRRSRLRRLHDATRDLLAARTPSEAAEIVSEAADEILDFPVNGVHLYDADADGLVPVAVSESSVNIIGDPPVLDGGLAWRAYHEGESRAYGDVTAEDPYNADTPIRSEMYLPLGDHGVLVVSSERVDAFDDSDVRLGEVLAANAAQALDRIARERELRRQNERLERFASIVSHDLRDPLNAAIATTALAKAGDEAALDDLDATLDRMDAIIEDVMELTRHGQAVDDTARVDVRSVVEDGWATAGDDDATLVVEDDLPVVDANRSRLRTAVENLFDDSVEHSSTSSRPGADDAEHGPTDVTVTVGPLDDRTGFYVADDGSGIPDAEADAVFERGHTTAAEGTGLGLSIVRAAVETHGWEIRLTESETGGARFEITGVDPVE